MLRGDVAKLIQLGNLAKTSRWNVDGSNQCVFEDHMEFPLMGRCQRKNPGTRIQSADIMVQSQKLPNDPPTAQTQGERDSKQSERLAIRFFIELCFVRCHGLLKANHV